MWERKVAVAGTDVVVAVAAASGGRHATRADPDCARTGACAVADPTHLPTRPTGSVSRSSPADRRWWYRWPSMAIRWRWRFPTCVSTLAGLRYLSLNFPQPAAVGWYPVTGALQAAIVELLPYFPFSVRSTTSFSLATFLFCKLSSLGFNFNAMSRFMVYTSTHYTLVTSCCWVPFGFTRGDSLLSAL